MGSIFRALLKLPLLQPLLRPLMRLLVATIAVPTFRFILRRVVRVQEIDQELERDLELWFRASVVMLVASANMEDALFGWVPLDLKGEEAWLAVGLRLLLAVGVIESMPDQELFAVIHPGPPKIRITKLIADLRVHFWDVVWGVFCKHLNRTSPVFVIMTAIFTGPVGWVCYTLAITQYLIIGLVTSRDKAMDVLGEFDRQVARRRAEIIEEFELDEAVSSREKADSPAPAPAPAPPDSDQPADNAGRQPTPSSAPASSGSATP